MSRFRYDTKKNRLSEIGQPIFVIMPPVGVQLSHELNGVRNALGPFEPQLQKQKSRIFSRLTI